MQTTLDQKETLAPNQNIISKLKNTIRTLSIKKRNKVVGLVLVLIIIYLFTLTFITNNSNDPEKSIFNFNQDNKSQFNEQVVKTFTPPSGTAFKYASPMLYREHIYIGTSERIGYDNAPVAKGHDNYFYKFDLDFNVIWQYPLGKKMVIGGAVMDSQQNIYFATELLNDKDNANKKEQIYTTVYLTSLTESGKFRWEKQISDTDEYWDHAYLTPAISSDDIIYVGNSHFFAFDSAGKQLAQYPENDLIINEYGGAPIIDSSGNVYFTSPEPVAIDKQWNSGVIRAYKFTPKLRAIVWSSEMGNEILDNEGGNSNGGGGQVARGIESPPVFGIAGKSIYGTVGCTISKINTETGELIWSIKPDGATGHFNASPAIDNEDNLYIGTKSNNESRFYAISADGQQLWRTEIGSDLYNSPILGDDNLVYVGSETNPKGKLHAIDKKSGEIKWSIFTDKEFKVPDFSHDGMLLYQGYVYVGVHSADEGNESGVYSPSLYKIRVDANGYLPNAAWPRIYGNNLNSNRLDPSPLAIEDLSPIDTNANQALTLINTPTPVPTIKNIQPSMSPIPTIQATITPKPNITIISTNPPIPTATITPTPTTYQLELNSVSTPYVNESDILSVNEAYSMDPNNPYWGFVHPGVDFMISGGSIPVQASTSGTIGNLAIEKSEGIMGWHAGFCIDHGINAVCYNLESFGSTDEIGNLVRANVFVQNGSVVNQGDIIGNLIYGGSGSHIDFGITYPGTRICPEPYFTQAARESVMRLIHKTQPTWPMCY